LFFAVGEGVQALCPLVLVDGTFLIGKYRGVLMIVVGVDPNNQLVPLAFALAEGENDDS
jgi:hypothetical protein